MKRILATILLLVPAIVLAQNRGNIVVTGSFTAASASCLTTNCATLIIPTDTVGAAIQLTGTFAGTIQFEATTAPGGTYVPIAGVPVGAGASATSATTTGVWQFSAAGLAAVRARVSAYTSGTVAARLVSATGPPANATSVSATITTDTTGLATSGNQTSGNQKTQICDSGGDCADISSTLAMHVLVDNTSSSPGSTQLCDGTASCATVTGGRLNVSGDTTITQNSTTLGENGILAMGATTTTPPTYTTGKSNPLSLDTDGNLRVVSPDLTYNATQPTLTDGQTTDLQVDSRGNLKTLDKVCDADGQCLDITSAGGAHVYIDNPSSDPAHVIICSDATHCATVTSGKLDVNADVSLNGLAQESTTSGQTGLMAMGAVTTAAPTYTTGKTDPVSLDTSGRLRVVAPQLTYNSTPPSLTNGQTADFQIDNTGALRVNVASVTGGNAAASATGSAVPASADYNGINVGGTLRGNTGTNTSGSVYAADVAIQNTPAVTCAACATAATQTSGSQKTQVVDGSGNVQPSGDAAARPLFVKLTDGTNTAADPCTFLAWTTVAISQTASTKVISQVSAKKNYICALVVIAGAAEIMNVVEGTGTTCGTSTAAIVGSTTAANGLSFVANGGFVNPIKIPGSSTNVDTCITQSGSNRLAGYVAYVQQ